MSKSEAGRFDLEGEVVKINDTSIAGNCTFSGALLIVGDLTIAGSCRFEQAVLVAPGAKVTINGQTWVPTDQA